MFHIIFQVSLLVFYCSRLTFIWQVSFFFLYYRFTALDYRYGLLYNTESITAALVKFLLIYHSSSPAEVSSFIIFYEVSLMMNMMHLFSFSKSLALPLNYTSAHTCRAH